MGRPRPRPPATRLLRPLFLQEQLLDATRVKQVVKGEVAKHDEDGIVIVLSCRMLNACDFARPQTYKCLLNIRE